MLEETLKVFLEFAERDASDLFKRLDPNFMPQVLLFAFARGKGSEDFALPAWDHFDQGRIADVRARVSDVPDHLCGGYTDRATEIAIKCGEEFTKHRLKILEAIESALDSAAQEDFSYFAGLPVLMDQHFVCPVLRLTKRTCDLYSEDLSKRRYDQRSGALCFLLSAVGGFLSHCRNSLEHPDTYGVRPPLAGAVAEFLRHVGADLISRVWRAKWLTPPAIDRETGRGNSFASLDEIAALPYEGGNAAGNMALAALDHPNLTLRLEFDDPVPIWNHRRVRKLLELTRERGFLLSDTQWVYGMAEVNQTLEYDETAESLFFVTFEGQHTWKLSHAAKNIKEGKDMMLVVRGIPRLPRAKFDKDEFESKAREQLPGVTDAQIDRLFELANAAARGRHGAVIVVSTKAGEEARRLKKRSTTLRSPIPLDLSLVQPLTAIDGAVLIEPDATCHAIGVILDGTAKEDEGNPSRGARYNSAVTYASDNQCLVIVVSQDGYPELLPKPLLR